MNEDEEKVEISPEDIPWELQEEREDNLKDNEVPDPFFEVQKDTKVEKDIDPLSGKEVSDIPTEEDIERAYEIIKKGPANIPGLGVTSPIVAPSEEAQIDPDDLPWELKNAEDATDDE